MLTCLHQNPTQVEIQGQPSSLSFAPVPPYSYAVSSGSRISLFVPGNDKPIKSFTHFRNAALGGVLRSDGALLISGTGDGRVKLFDVVNASLLRTIHAHSAAVHWVQFLPDGVRFVTGADDNTLKFWDLATGQCTHTIQKAHNDYIRCGTTTSLTVLTGSYDGTVKAWDARPAVKPMEPFLTLNHGAPVEAVLAFPGGNLVASAGGQVVKIWSLLNPAEPLVVLRLHVKTVTSLAYGAVDGAGVLFTGGLDHLIKAVSVSDWTVQQTWSAPAPVLALGVAADFSVVVAALSDNTLLVRSNQKLLSSATTAERVDAVLPLRARSVTNGSDLDWLNRLSRGESITTETRRQRIDDDVLAQRPGTICISAEETRVKLTPFERLLRQFEFRRALDMALGDGDETTILALIIELERRGVLERTVSGANATMLVKLCDFCRRELSQPLAVAVVHRLVDVIIDHFGEALQETPDLRAAAVALLQRYHSEVKVLTTLTEITGIIDAVI